MGLPRQLQRALREREPMGTAAPIPTAIPNTYRTMPVASAAQDGAPSARRARADADLFRPQARAVRHDAENADARQRQRQHADGAGHHARHARARACAARNPRSAAARRKRSARSTLRGLAQHRQATAPRRSARAPAADARRNPPASAADTARRHRWPRPDRMRIAGHADDGVSRTPFRKSAADHIDVPYIWRAPARRLITSRAGSSPARRPARKQAGSRITAKYSGSTRSRPRAAGRVAVIRFVDRGRRTAPQHHGRFLRFRIASHPLLDRRPVRPARPRPDAIARERDCSTAARWYSKPRLTIASAAGCAPSCRRRSEIRQLPPTCAATITRRTRARSSAQRHLLAAVLDRSHQVLLSHLPGRQRADHGQRQSGESQARRRSPRQSVLKSKYGGSAANARRACPPPMRRTGARRLRRPPTAPFRSPVAGRCAIAGRRAPCARQARGRGPWRATSPGCRDWSPPQPAPGCSAVRSADATPTNARRSAGSREVLRGHRRFQPLIGVRSAPAAPG